ncbi:MAG: LUD domain-containing protein [Candidatus Aminicenantaceae bacterium]
MFPSNKKKVKKALKNKSLQNALKKASLNHFKKFNKTKNEIPWEEYKQKAADIKEKCIKILPQLIHKFREEARKAGANVYIANTPKEALAEIENILSRKKVKLIVKSKSMVSEEIHLNEHLQKKGYKILETDLGEWIIQLAKERPSHITAPALHKTRTEIADLLSSRFKQNVSSDPKEIAKLSRKGMRKAFMNADIGISGANIGVAETGTLIIISNEGNAKLVTSLPPVHIAIITTEKFVETLEESIPLIKVLTIASSGSKLTSYITYITGPSHTTDIEKEFVVGVHGPKELHIIILDNGRLAVQKDKDFSKTLSCLKCGGCMLVCPVFQLLGGHIYGGPVYPGGIGILLSEVNNSLKKSSTLYDFCADCKKCEEFCPVGIPTGELILKLKNKKGPNLWEKALSRIYSNKSLTEQGANLLSIAQKPWLKKGRLQNLPFPFTKGKSFPALNLKKTKLSMKQKQSKIYLFQGCLGRFFFPEIRESVIKSLPSFGLTVIIPSEQVCCGAPNYHLGNINDVKKLALINYNSIKKENPDFIITICPTGNAMLKNSYPEIIPEFKNWTDKIFDFTQFMVQKNLMQKTGNLIKKEKVFYHYPCHYINELKLKSEPKRLLESSGYQFEEEEEPLTCCGFCGIFSFKNPHISSKLWEKKKAKILKKKAPIIATDCPGCLFQIKAGFSDQERRIHHTAELVARAMK